MNERRMDAMLATTAGAHRELRTALEELSRFLEENPPLSNPRASAEITRRISKRLARLHDTLAAHFREEEAAGLPDLLIGGLPHIADRVASLRAEHDRLLSQILALVTATDRHAEDGAPYDVNLREWLASFIARISEHEERETLVIDQAYSRELGVHD
jgi:hypothetical protein